MTKVAAILSMFILLAGCVPVNRPAESRQTRALQPVEAVRQSEVPLFGPDQHTHSALDARRPNQVLALSSGGAAGAYGAGILVGWSESGTRPQFDVVTGVSTGALMAVLAFLGPEYDGQMKQFYTETTERDIYLRRGPIGFATDAFFDNGPLKKQIEKVVDADLLERIAAEHKRGRRLYVATTNLDAGELVIWDMGDIALGGRANDVQFFQKVLRASAAVPAFFPPVYIKPERGIEKRQAHVDGAVKAPVLVGDFMFPPNAKQNNLYLIVNGYTTRLNDDEPVSGRVFDIAAKSISELVRELTEDTLFRAYVLTRTINAKFYMTSIPDDLKSSSATLEFDQEHNQKLFAAGRKVGLTGVNSWRKEPPHLTPYEISGIQ